MIKEKYNKICDFLKGVKKKYWAISKMERELNLTHNYLHNFLATDYSITKKSDKIDLLYNLLIKKW
jgi:hypothetical protein